MIGLCLFAHGDIVVLPWLAGKSKRGVMQRPKPSSADEPGASAPIPWRRPRSPRPCEPAFDRRSEGLVWEQEAARFLCQQGLELVASNVQCRVGEIDLIMAHGRTAVIVEVRRRVDQGYGSAGDSIGYSKRRKVTKAASFWWQHTGCKHFEHLRFDVVVFGQNSEPEWFKAAWTDPSWL